MFLRWESMRVEPGLLEISLKEPAPWILEILAHPVSFPLHSTAMDDPLHAPVNGPFLLTDWTPRASLKLVNEIRSFMQRTV